MISIVVSAKQKSDRGAVAPSASKLSHADRGVPGGSDEPQPESQSRRSLLDLVGLGQDLEELLGCKVDVRTDPSLHPALRERVLAEARPL